MMNIVNASKTVLYAWLPALFRGEPFLINKGLISS